MDVKDMAAQILYEIVKVSGDYLAEQNKRAMETFRSRMNDNFRACIAELEENEQGADDVKDMLCDLRASLLELQDEIEGVRENWEERGVEKVLEALGGLTADV